ncbi:uncharacterized protein ACBR49_004101 isoform 2-T2 [Aulostomus maculatus]
MRGRCKRKEPRGRMCEVAAESEAGLSPLPGDTATYLTELHTPVPGTSMQDEGGVSKCSSDGGDKVYLGVRVKMPVKDLLRNVRLAQGWNPQELQDMYSKTIKGDKKRVKTRKGHPTTNKKHPTKSLEELAIIVEVLEEDLRTSSAYCSHPHSFSSSASPMSPDWSLDPNGAGYNSDESDEMIPSPQSYTTYSPGTLEYQQALSPPDLMHVWPAGVHLHRERRNGGKGDGCFGLQTPNWNCSDFFWAQLLKEESQLRDISDAALLATDRHGRTALHTVVCDGKRALAFAIAKRMAALNSLDLKDSDGMTALLLAANHNQHLMVEDLVRLGAGVNERNNSGKSCLHLSAEKGYIRVLEVMKHTMMDGVYVDVEATDKSGMSVLQCASLALKATLHELDISESPTHTRIHELRKEQIMETLECLLQMGSYFHTMVCVPLVLILKKKNKKNKRADETS